MYPYSCEFGFATDEDGIVHEVAWAPRHLGEAGYEGQGLCLRWFKPVFIRQPSEGVPTCLWCARMNLRFG